MTDAIVYLIASIIQLIVVILIVSSLSVIRGYLKSIAEDVRRITQNWDKSQQQANSKSGEKEKEESTSHDSTHNLEAAKLASDISNTPQGEHGIQLESFKGGHLQKLDVISEIQVITGLSFRDAETIIASVPAILQEGISREAAEEIKERLEVLGVVVKIL